MKEYKDVVNNKPIFESEQIEGWTKTEILEGERIYSELNAILESEGVEGLANLEEGILANIVSGVAGFIIGPSVGKVIANALGVQKGILFDMFNSRLVGAALGAAITKSLSR